MARHVFILGAGASQKAGGPLMSNFLNKAQDLQRQDLQRSDEQNIDNDAFERTFEAISELQLVHSKSRLDTTNVESVFGALEMARLFGHLGKMDGQIVRNLTDDIAKVIVQTVEHYVRFELENSQVVAPLEYRRFANLVNAMQAKKSHCAVITFNYDVALDLSLSHGGGPLYCLDGERGPSTQVPLLKLHGSANWNIIENGHGQEAIEPVSVSNFAAHMSRREAENSSLSIRMKDEVPRPFIVPPSWSKLHRYNFIENVWRRAATELRSAENIYVMGYSLPESDTFFRLLYALGTAGAARLRRFWVFDPASAVEANFRKILGQAAENAFVFRQKKFGDAVAFVDTYWSQDSAPVD
jgi:hypothetical protein